MKINNMTFKEWKKLKITSVEQVRNLIGEDNLKSCLLDCYKDKPDEIDSYDMEDIFYIGIELISNRIYKDKDDK